MPDAPDIVLCSNHNPADPSVRSLNIVCKLTNQCSCPDSVHVLYVSIEFLAANCRCELKAKMACSVEKQTF